MKQNMILRVNQDGTISILNAKLLKLVHKLIYLSSHISSTESYVNICIHKGCTAVDKLTTIWKSNLFDKMKQEFFQAVAMTVLLYGCTTGILTKSLKKKLNGNHKRMLRAVLKKSCKQHPTKKQLYCYLPPISQTIQSKTNTVRGVRINAQTTFSYGFLHGHTNVSQAAKSYIHQLCANTV